MAGDFKIVIEFDLTAKISAQVQEKAIQAVQKAARDIEAHAKTVVPVRTGNLKNSILAEQESDLVWHVAPHTDYAIYVEYGTSRMGARPYMRPAAEKVGPVFIEAMKQIVKM
jgi:HK97 gp10 family phage protein